MSSEDSDDSHEMFNRSSDSEQMYVYHIDAIYQIDFLRTISHRISYLELRKR